LKLKYKWKYGTYIIGMVAILQGFAWATGHDGQVFALTSLSIGGIIGALFGFSIAKK
jgi:hypothetical protein